MQVWDNFLALAASAITCTSTDQSAETSLDSSQHYVLFVRLTLPWAHQRAQSCGVLSMAVWTIEAWVDSPAGLHAEGYQTCSWASLLQGTAGERASVLECHSELHFSGRQSTFQVYLIRKGL